MVVPKKQFFFENYKIICMVVPKKQFFLKIIKLFVWSYLKNSFLK